MPTRTVLIRAYAMLGLVMLLWSGNSIVGRAVRFEIPPLTLSFLRWALASALILPFAARGLWRERAVLRQHWRMLVMAGVIGVGMFNSLLYVGLQHSTASNALLIQAATPAFVLVFDRAIYGRKPGSLHLLAVLAAAAGVFVIVVAAGTGSETGQATAFGDLLLLLSAAVWALYTVLLRSRPPLSGINFLAATFVIGMVSVAPFAAFEIGGGAQVQWNGQVLAALFYVAAMSSLLAYVLFNAAANAVGPVVAGQTLTLMPLIGALLAAALLGEALHLYHLVGMVLILAGIALGIAAERRASSAGPAPEQRLEEPQ